PPPPPPPPPGGGGGTKEFLPLLFFFPEGRPTPSSYPPPAPRGGGGAPPPGGGGAAPPPSPAPARRRPRRGARPTPPTALGRRAGQIAARGLGFAARDDGVGIAARRLVDAADAHEFLGVHLQPAQNAFARRRLRSLLQRGCELRELPRERRGGGNAPARER